MRRYWMLAMAGGMLVLAVLVTAWAALSRAEEIPWAPLADRLPMDIEGWHSQDLPLGDTEGAIEAVGKLNYNDYLYRVYRKDKQEVFVYAMFWRQGRISVREMSGHTPDGCWVSNGARHCVPSEIRSLRVGEFVTKKGEVREFQFPQGGRVAVVWWHLWGGETVDRSFAVKSILPILKECWRWLVMNRGVSKDQLLVRVHATEANPDFLEYLPVRRFLEALPEARADKTVIAE